MDKEKYVDEDWKESAAEDKERLAKLNEDSGKVDSKDNVESSDKPDDAASSTEPSEGSEGSEMELNFLNYVASLGYQSMIFLGEVAHPMTNQIEKNLEQAKFLVDTLVLIREKTKGNLSKKEDDMLNSTIYELQVKYVEQTENQVSEPQEETPS